METKLISLSNTDLLANLSRLSSLEGETTVSIILHLSEVEKRKLYLEKGYPSLFGYCVNVLKYGEASAGRRVTAARSIEKFPELLEPLKERELSLSTICQISRVLTADNVTAVLEAIRGKSAHKVEQYVAELCPKAKVREGIQPVTVKAAVTDSAKANMFFGAKTRVTSGISCAGRSGQC